MVESENAEVLAVLEKRLTVFRNLHAALAESESILSRALFQSHQRLDVIAEAWKAQFCVEDLVRFARLISSSHSTQAPAGWMLGDPRRPYPNDDQMKESILRRLPDPSSSGPLVGHKKLALSKSLSGSLSSPTSQTTIPITSPLSQLALSLEQEIQRQLAPTNGSVTSDVN